MIVPSPVWEYAKSYYFDVETNKVYGPKKNSYGYWHEVSHYIDHKNKLYRVISLFINQWNQNVAMMIVCVLIVLLINSSLEWNILTHSLGTLFIPYCLWSTQEELRATINGFVWRNRKWMNLNINNN